MKIAKGFLWSAAGILLLTAIAKFISAMGHAKILLEHDPVTGLTYRYLFYGIAIVETGVGLACVFNKHYAFSAGLVAWLSTSFVAYRVCLYNLHYPQPCHCLGNLTDAIHVSPRIADAAMKIILAYLLVGSYAMLLLLAKRAKSDRTVLALSS